MKQMDECNSTRRRWLSTCAGATFGMAALAGCSSTIETDAPSPEDDPGAVAGDGEYGSWPMERYNASNRLSVPYDGLDTEPEIRWTAELDAPIHPPVVFNDTAFVSHHLGTYTAIDITGGEPIWDYETTGNEAIAVSDRALFVAGDGVEALDHDEGTVLWTTNHDQSVKSLRVYEDLVYAGLEDRIIVLDGDGERHLEFEVTEMVQSLAINNEHIYVRSRPDEDGSEFAIAAYERDSGDQLWDHEVTQVEQWFDDRLTKTFPVVDGTVYTVNDNAVISIDGASGSVDEVAAFDEEPWNRPTIHGDTVYVRVREPTAVTLETGDVRADWEPDENTTYPLIHGGSSIFSIRPTGSLSPPNILSMNPTTGEVNWEGETPEQSEAHLPIILNELILLPIDDPGLIAFS